MDLVIPYRSFGDDGSSLKYALRGAAIFIRPFDKVVIVGDQPDNFHRYYHIPFTDEPQGRWRERNLFNKIAMACMDNNVSEDFIYFHDDHFLLCPYIDIPYYYQDRFEGNDIYKNTVRNTLRIYPDAKNFDVHFPMVINKQDFLTSVAKLDWSKPYGYCIKTMYCMAMKITGNYYLDCKIRKQYLNTENLIAFLSYQKWFSIDDLAMNDTMLDALNRIYSLKTIYER